jgi:hypothetical protein
MHKFYGTDWDSVEPIEDDIQALINLLWHGKE